MRSSLKFKEFKELKLKKILKIFFLWTKHYMLGIGIVTGKKQAIKLSSLGDEIANPLQDMDT